MPTLDENLRRRFSPRHRASSQRSALKFHFVERCWFGQASGLFFVSGRYGRIGNPIPAQSDFGR